MYPIKQYYYKILGPVRAALEGFEFFKQVPKKKCFLEVADAVAAVKHYNESTLELPV